MTIKQIKRKARAKKFIKRNLLYIIATLIIVVVLSFIILNGKVCTGDYEGDVDAVCIKIIK
jgi:hypothetical protein